MLPLRHAMIFALAADCRAMMMLLPLLMISSFAAATPFRRHDIINGITSA